jgi:carboxypeptidase C (cathepsin A)
MTEKSNGEERKDEESPRPPPDHHEEATVETTHALQVGRRKIPYRAVAGRVILTEEDGEKRASFFHVAYFRSDSEDPAHRPLVFAFNGGPGSSSVWLHLGVFGPRRVMVDDNGMPGPPPGQLTDNVHSLIDVADVVFIDPVGTGFSRAIPGDEQEKFHHFTRDIESVGEFIRIFLTRHGRWASPKFLAGESYGTTRAAGLAAHLLEKRGIYLNGLVLISAVLNFGTSGFDRETFTFQVGNDLPYVLFLPTYAATAWYHAKLDRRLQRLSLHELLEEVEAFARADYARALLLGDGLDEAERQRIAQQVATYTGLDVGYVERYRLRIEILRFCKELLRDRRRTVGRIDTRYTGIDRFTDGDSIESDPFTNAITGAYAAMFNDYVRRDLEYESDLPYHVLSLEINQNWDYEDFKNANVDTSESLRRAMSKNPHMRVFVANGLYDLATPYLATRHTFGHMGLDPEVAANVTSRDYAAGHMMYLHEPSLESLAQELRSFIAG